jgi:hypothetical protein
MSVNTTPATAVDGNPITGALWNAEVRDFATGVQAAWTNDARASTVIWTAATTNPVLGNGTLSSRYMQVGKTIKWTVELTMGSTTTFGTGAWQLAVPVAMRAAIAAARPVGGVFDSSAGAAGNFPVWGTTSGTTTTLNLRVLATSAPLVALTGTAPVTFATGDALSIELTYEAA